MRRFSFFKKRKTEKAPLPAETMLHINVRGGVLITCSDNSCVWILAPFHDTRSPVQVKAPDVKVDAVIVLNHDNPGCLPLTSFFAMDAGLPAHSIYVTDPSNPHDWHPGYPDQAGINTLLNVKPLPAELRIGELVLTPGERNTFIRARRINPHSGRLAEFYVGTGISYSEDREEESRYGSKELYFCGSFSEQDFEPTFRAVVNAGITYAAGHLHLFMCHDWINGNSHAYTEAFNLMGYEVYVSGAAAEEM